MTADDKVPSFIIHTCPIRDECWQNIDERTLGSRTRRTGPLEKRPHSCGFEATRLEFCPKYRRWSGDNAKVISGQLALAL